MSNQPTMQTTNQYFDPEEQKAIKKQGALLGPDAIRAVEAEWPQLIAAVKEHMAKGTDPNDPAVQKLAKRWMELVNMFTGGNPKVAEGLKKMYQDKGPALKQQFGDDMPDLGMFEYIQKTLRYISASGIPPS